MGDVQLLFKKVLERIRPSRDERKKISGTVSHIKSRLERHLPKGVRMLLAGSIAKNTFLHDEGDIDLFLLFPKTFNKEAMGELVMDTVKKEFRNYEIAYAEHPYARIFVNGIKADIVPAYNITHVAHMGSAVDRSKFHVNFVKKYLKSVDGVLLLKKMLKSFRIYGADMKSRGVSGYLAELTVIKYGSMEKAMEAVSKWRFGEVVEINERWKDREKARQKFQGAPLIFIDPTDRNRNVASALSAENFSRLVLLARAFAKKPDERLFFPKPGKAKYMPRLIGITFKSPKIIDETKYGELGRLASKAARHLESKGFEVILAQAYDNGTTSACVIGVANELVGRNFIRHGPPLEMAEGVARFVTDKAFFREGRIVSMAQREATVAVEEARKACASGALPKHFERRTMKVSYLKKGSAAYREMERARALDELILSLQ
jgi:tRNA nucleotidyltransferase (CCA-adding enzyme)